MIGTKKQWLMAIAKKCNEEYIQYKKPKKGDTYNDIFRKESDEERRERVARDKANTQRIDNQVKR